MALEAEEEEKEEEEEEEVDVKQMRRTKDLIGCQKTHGTSEGESRCIQRSNAFAREVKMLKLSRFRV